MQLLCLTTLIYILSLRAVFADDNEEINPIHGADSIEAAEKELRTFFPPQATVAVIKPEAYSVPEQRGMLLFSE